MLSGSLGGNVDLGANFALRPSLDAFGLMEQQEGYVDSLGTAQSARNFATGRVSAGAELSYGLQLETALVTPHVGLKAQLTSEGDTADLAATGIGGAPETATGGVSAAAAGGVDIVLDGGARFALDLELSGIATPSAIWALNGRLNQSF